MRQAKKPETEERQNASTPPSKWTCPREQTPATANTSYAVPQRRSRRRLAGSPKPPMESRQAHSIHGVALSKASSRPRCATRASPHRAAKPAPPTTLPKVINKGAAPRPPRPWHQHEADPGAKKQKYAQNCNFFAIANCREASKRGLTPGKAANRTHSGPFPPRGGRKGVRNRKKVAQKSEFFVSAKRIVATEQFLRKTRVPSMPIKPNSSTEPQRIDHTSTHALTLGKDPALARLKNATSEEKRWAK